MISWRFTDYEDKAYCWWGIFAQYIALWLLLRHLKGSSRSCRSYCPLLLHNDDIGATRTYHSSSLVASHDTTGSQKWVRFRQLALFGIVYTIGSPTLQLRHRDGILSRPEWPAGRAFRTDISAPVDHKNNLVPERRG
jgi:hypothetical protein